ncbi:MAG: alanine racemase [Oscillospiraceae bacterium]|nr:alanine racemase [Oscillospiraceae bacterium]
MKAYIVEKAALETNIRIVLEKAGSAVVWAVLKGDGYGLGIVPLAKILREQGVGHFAVTELGEAQQLRDAGFTEEPILMLRATCDRQTLEQMLDLHVIATIGSYEDAVALNGIAAARSTVAEAHLELNTGMGRYGFSERELDKVLNVYTYMNSLSLSGVYTHFHSAFAGKDATEAQFDLFRTLLGKIQAAGHETGMTHCCNSSALFRFPEMRLDAVRIGSAFLGRLSFRARTGLQRVGYAETTVEEIRWLQKGETCGYGAGWKARKASRIAVVNLGNYNGFAVERGHDLFRVQDCLRGILSNLKGIFIRKSLWAEVDGVRCRVVGHVGMVHTCINVTGLTCAAGDKVILAVNPLVVKGMDIVYR